MTTVGSRLSVWEALAGRAPGRPLGPADVDVWSAVVERLNPARARPVLRSGVEHAELVSVRGVPYVMLKSPDDRGACYLRLSPAEWQLAQLMDGTRTVARLVAEFARIAGRLAPDQVTRVVADLAGNRMLAELPVDAFRPLDAAQRRPWPVRFGRGVLAAARGRRMVLADIDPLVDLLYRAGGRLLFTRAAAILLGLLATAGLALFSWTWWRGDQSVFLTNGSYAAGAAVLLGLNVLALASHELGHALATRHAGRRVPAAGLLIYFGIPSVFVDTTDVWMAGRRARMLTTISGPAAGLILAGAVQVVGLLVPAAAPWTFKLAFAWYLNALFNLNPFLALDGYYLLMDWLEIPNLRARALAYVGARLRRRPPSWAQLDREGRLVALYGMVAVLWAVIAVNIAWRIWTDRVSGLVTGLWRSGWPARLLLAAVVAGLGAPLVYVCVGWLGRRYRRLRAHWVERRQDIDTPRRLDALRRSVLARLPAAALAELAAAARWVHPRNGQQLVIAGAAAPDVFVVVDGAAEARRPGDPVGTVRERVGPGGLINLASALTGAPASLSWYTAGTRLLAVPAPVVAQAVGPLPGPPPADRAAAEALVAEAPALRGLTAEERMGLVGAAQREMLPPGASVTLADPSEATLVESGVVVLPDGTQLRRGSLIGPEADPTGPVATARTAVRLWRLPAVSGLPLLLGTGPEAVAAHAAAPRHAPTAGVHPVADYPPLAVPPGGPPIDVDDAIDRRFERRLRWLVLLLLLFGLLFTGSNLVPGPAWAEMPTDNALLRVEQGTATVTTGRRSVLLQAGDKVYVAEGDRIDVRSRSTGRLIFRGGATVVLCGGARADVGPLWSKGERLTNPYGELILDTGRLLADTESTSGAFQPLTLTVASRARTIASAGPAWFAVTGGVVEVATGAVRLDGDRQPATGQALDCGDRRPLALPARSSGPPAPTVAPSGSPSPSVPPSVTPSPTGSPTATVGMPSAAPSSRSPSRTTSPTTSRSPARSPSPTPSTSTPSPTPTDRTAPVIMRVRVSPPVLAQDQLPFSYFCWDSDGRSLDLATATVDAAVSDPTDPPGNLSVRFDWRLDSDGTTGGGGMSRDGQTFYGTFSVPYARSHQEGGTITVTVTARDRAGNVTTSDPVTIRLAPCTYFG